MTDRCPKCGRTQTRSTEANRRLWALYHLISESVKPHDMQYSAETWHLYFKGHFLGCHDILMPNGKTITEPNSTAKLSTSEFTDYMDQVEFFAGAREIYLPE